MKIKTILLEHMLLFFLPAATPHWAAIVLYTGNLCVHMGVAGGARETVKNSLSFMSLLLMRTQTQKWLNLPPARFPYCLKKND